jgi:hypothetical protein
MKRYLNYLFALLTLASLSSLPLMAQDDDDDEDNEEEVENACENKYGLDSAETVKYLSLFNQYFQTKKYVESFPYFYYLLTHAPCVSKNITYNGPVIIKKVLLLDEYKPRFAGLVDTIMLCHELRIKFYGREGYVKGKWANDMAKLQPPKRQEALAMFAESIELQGNKTSYTVPTWYMQAATKELKYKRLSLDSVIAIYDQMNAIVQYNLESQAGNAKKLAKWQKAEENITKLLTPWLDCDKLIEVKKPQLEAKPDDLDQIKQVLSLLDRGKCTEKDYYLELSEIVAAKEPSAEAFLSLAKAFKGKGKDSKAKTYFSKAVEAGIENVEEKAETYYTLGVYALSDGQLSTSRNYARKALEAKADMGKSYLLIGDAYASSSSSCKDDKLSGKSVFWAAVDKYYRAKSIDPSVSETADKKIAKYSAYFPDKETAFFLGLNNGDSYTVGCWIGESTTVRTID